MTMVVLIVCDECGERIPDYAYDAATWTETDDDEDLCPSCSRRRATVPSEPTTGGQDG